MPAHHKSSAVPALYTFKDTFKNPTVSSKSLREPVALPAPVHIAGLVLALLLARRLGRVPCRRRVLAGLQARVPAVLVLSPDLPCQRALVAWRPRRRRVGRDDGVGRDGWVRRRRALAVQPVGLLELELPCPLGPVRLCFRCPVCVDGLLRKVVGPAARCNQRRPAVAVVLLAHRRPNREPLRPRAVTY